MRDMLTNVEPDPYESASAKWDMMAVRPGSAIAKISCPEELDDLMKNTVRIIDGSKQEKPTLNIMKLFSRIPRMYAGLVSDWCDEDKLNILHHGIINNCPEVVEFLLTETPYFPGVRMPTINPYAHLAAVLGHTECLRQILLHRPKDFFRSQTQNHLIVLPDHLKRRLKFDENMVALSRSKDNLLSKIKKVTQTAEAAMQALSKDDNESIQWEEELKNLDSSIKQSPIRFKRMRSYETVAARIAAEKDGVARTAAVPRKMQFVEQVGKPDRETEKKLENIEKNLLRMPEKLDANNFKMKIQRGRGEHLITVYRQVSFDSAKGVINGAGRPVFVQYSETAHTFPSKIEMNHSKQANLWPYPKSKQKHSLSIKPKQKSIKKRKIPEVQIPTQSTRFPPFKPVSKKSDASLNQSIEIGIRGNKKYKDFEIKQESREPGIKGDPNRYMNKTPLILAAERGFIDCVHVILEIIVLKNNPLMISVQPLTLATKARSPEAIVMLLGNRISQDDYQSALLVAIHEMYPDCLTALTSTKLKERERVFNGTNLYHILYSQTLMTNCRLEVMPEMTRVLIKNKEDVNAHNVPRTFPMYTLISCAFNVMRGRQVVFYAECLKLLLEAKANPHFNEDTVESASKMRLNLSFTRSPFYSAINCIMESAKNSIKFFESKYWPKLFFKNFVTTVEIYDRTRRRILNDTLLDYMDSVCELGLDRTVIRSLLRYGGNPDFKEDGNYPINLYFENIFPYLTRFEVIDSYTKYQTELQDLMIMSRFMTRKCIVDAKTIFLRKHLLSAPVQGLPISRYFSYLINEILKSPQSLQQLAALNIWLQVNRNVKRARLLPLPRELLNVIIP